MKNEVQAIDFYKKACGAKELACMMTPDGKAVAHAEIEICDSKLMLTDEILEMKNPSLATLGGSSGGIFCVWEEADKTSNQAVAEGAKILYSGEDQFWGDRH
jgi:PhnB protein